MSKEDNMRMSQSISQKDQKILYGKASGKCSFCKKDLVSGPSNSDQIGQMAHIIAKAEKGPRYDSSYPKDKLNTYENLILLCPNCHAKIDHSSEEYPAELLRRKKEEHEKWCERNLGKNISSVNFPELDVAAKAIATGEYLAASGFQLTPIKDKIDKNQLTQEVVAYIRSGMCRSREVKEYLKKQEQLDSGFPNRLKDGFQKKYQELKQTNPSGDDLFWAFTDFINSILREERERAAGIAILCHLFELCDVFEK